MKVNENFDNNVLPGQWTDEQRQEVQDMLLAKFGKTVIILIVSNKDGVNVVAHTSPKNALNLLEKTASSINLALQHEQGFTIKDLGAVGSTDEESKPLE